MDGDKIKCEFQPRLDVNRPRMSLLGVSVCKQIKLLLVCCLWSIEPCWLIYCCIVKCTISIWCDPALCDYTLWKQGYEQFKSLQTIC